MTVFLRLGLFLLFVGGMILSPVSASVFENPTVNLSSHTYDANETDVNTGKSNNEFNELLSKKLHTDQKQADGHGGDSSEFVPLISQRLVNFAQHDPVNSQPVYLLVYEFFSPLVPSLTIGYRIDFSSTLDWALHLTKTSNRLSGWKDSNLLYRFSQTRSA